MLAQQLLLRLALVSQVLCSSRPPPLAWSRFNNGPTLADSKTHKRLLECVLPCRGLPVASEQAERCHVI